MKSFCAFSADLNKNNITLDVHFEKPITLDGNYDIKGKVIILPITGEGLSKISLGMDTYFSILFLKCKSSILNFILQKILEPRYTFI